MVNRFFSSLPPTVILEKRCEYISTSFLCFIFIPIHSNMQMPFMVSTSGDSVLIRKEFELVGLSKRVEIDSHGFGEVNPA